MADPFLGEIRLFGFNYAPQGWMACNGQLLPIAQFTGLFAVLGTTYGGDGQTTFALPNLQGSAPLQQGQGTNLSNRSQGQAGGVAFVTLVADQLPQHTHTVQANSGAGDQQSPANAVAASAMLLRQGTPLYAADPGTSPQMNQQAVGIAGGSGSHPNMPPYLALLFCIAVEGDFPQRGP